MALKRRATARVTRLRRLTDAQEQRLAVLRHFSHLLDSAFVVPGTTYRIGLDPIVGLIPGIGDLVSPLFTIALLWQARDLRVPRLVQLRMIGNVAIDALLGVFPVVGDFFDLAWKANDMNLSLLERHAREERPPSTGDWVFAGALVVVLLAMAAAPLLLGAWLWSVLAS